MQAHKATIISLIATSLTACAVETNQTDTNAQRENAGFSTDALAYTSETSRTGMSLSSMLADVIPYGEPTTLNCVVIDSDFQPNPWLKQKGPTCWKYSWINANKALNGEFPSPEKLKEFDECLTEKGIDPKKGLPLTDEAFDTARECKEEITEEPGPGDYPGTDVEFEVYDWDSFKEEHDEDETDDTGIAIEEEDTGESIVVGPGTGYDGTSDEGDIRTIEAEETDDDEDECENKTVGVIVITKGRSGHAMTITEAPTKDADGNWNFKYVDPNGGGEKSGQITDKGKLKNCGYWSGWKVVRIELEKKEEGDC